MLAGVRVRGMKRRWWGRRRRRQQAKDGCRQKIPGHSAVKSHSEGKHPASFIYLASEIFICHASHFIMGLSVSSAHSRVRTWCPERLPPDLPGE